MKTSIKVQDSDIEHAKQQIQAFENSDAGKWRYKGVEAWRGIVCEMLASKWLEENFTVTKAAKGLDTSGICDEYDLIINNKKIEIKSATCYYYKSIMPKIYDINTLPKDLYIGVRYNEEITPNEIEIIGFLTLDEVKKYPIRQNKGAPYYDIPQKDFKPITNHTFD